MKIRYATICLLIPVVESFASPQIPPRTLDFSTSSKTTYLSATLESGFHCMAAIASHGFVATFSQLQATVLLQRQIYRCYSVGRHQARFHYRQKPRHQD